MAPDCVGAEVQAMVDKLQSGQVTQPAQHSRISAQRTLPDTIMGLCLLWSGVEMHD